MPTGVYKRTSEMFSTRKGVKRSEETKLKMSEAKLKNPVRYWFGKKRGVGYWAGKKRPEISGEKCYLWKGGKMTEYPELEQIRKSNEYKLWHKSNLERDWFTCQKCKKHGGELVVHHINNFADFSELRLAIDNGITLCKECHKKFHKIYGKKNNTKEQLNEFISKNN